MSNAFYLKLAQMNIKKNGKNFLPYLLTCIGMVAMFYMIISLSQNKGLNSDTLTSILSLGTMVTAIFSAIFLFYTNSFLIKQRKKELGLYNILGMEKRHIAKVILCETVIVSAVSIVGGLLIGILLDKLMFLALIRMFSYDIPFGFELSLFPVLVTIALFLAIFLLTFLRSVAQVHLANPIELLKGGVVGEREPKTKWLFALLGLISLGAGYYISITTTNPISAINLFFIAVVLVIIGTYLLFSTGSIAVLKLLRKNKGYYYQTKHFISVSGMIYRMKQNAVGLANICILSTAVLVMISTTLSMFIGMEDIMLTRYPRNILISTKNSSISASNRLKEWVNGTLDKNKITRKNELSYNYLDFVAVDENGSFDTMKTTKILSTSDSITNLLFIPLSDYNRHSDKEIHLNDGEVAIFSNRDQYSYDILSIFDMNFKVKEKLDEFVGNGLFASNIISSHFIIVKDMDVLDQLYKNQRVASGKRSADIQFYYGFDLDTSSEKITAIYHEIVSSENLESFGFEGTIECRDEAKNDFLAIYGGLFFIGIFLGILFIMATILIIYYKQISEGYDDKHRFDIMQKVGMGKDEIKKSIGSQVLTVFFLPLVTAGVHIIFAFPVITRLLAILNLTNISLFMVCTIACFITFALLYTLVYSITARVYYKIVS